MKWVLVGFILSILIIPYTVHGAEINITYGQTLFSFKGLGWNIITSPYDESGYNWTMIEKTFDKMDMEFARVGVSIDNWRTNQTHYNFETMSMRGLYRFLEYADDHNIYVLIGNWNTGGRFGTEKNWWLSEICHLDPENESGRWFIPHWCCGGQSGPWHDHPYDEDEFAESIAVLINHLKNVKGFESVKYVSIWNEPNLFYIPHCNSSVHVNGTSLLCDDKTYPEDFVILYKKLREHMESYNLTDVEIVGNEHSGDWMAMDDIGYTLSSVVEGKAIDNYIDYVSFHHYNDTFGTGGPTSQAKSQVYGNDPDGVKEKIILGEMGSSGASIQRPLDTVSKRFDNSFISVKKTIAEMKQGAFAVARWGYNGVIDEMNAINMSWGRNPELIPEAFNPYAILSASLHNTDISYIPRIYIESTGPYLDAVAVTFWYNGANRRSIWLISDGEESQIYDAYFNLINLNGDISLQKYFIDNEQSVIKKGDQFNLTISNPSFRDMEIPGMGIVVYTEYTDILNQLVCGNGICEQGETSYNCPIDCPSQETEGDLNNDGDVNLLDLGIVTSNFGLRGTDTGWNVTADVVPDGEIDIFDLVFIAGKFT